MINKHDLDSFIRYQIASRKRVAESDVFDLKRDEHGHMRCFCNPWHPCPPLVMVYARLGIHRYNLLKGTKFQLIRVRKYVKTIFSSTGCYYITSQAMDPTGSLRTFQTAVSEKSWRKFVLACCTARLRGEVTSRYPREYGLFHRLGNPMPEWPPLNPFQNGKPFDVVKKSELEDNDWIRLYLELAVATTYRMSTYRYGEAKDYNPSNLEILEVATETKEDEGPNPDDIMIIYIRYKDLCDSGVGKKVDRVAIIRRRFNNLTGWFSLEGETHSSESVLPKKVKKKRLVFRQRLGIHKPWRLISYRSVVCKSYKNHGVQDRQLHKTRWRLSVCKSYKNRGVDRHLHETSFI